MGAERCVNLTANISPPLLSVCVYFSVRFPFGRRRRGGPSEGSGFRIQGSVPPAERSADPGRRRAPVARGSPDRPVRGGARGPVRSPRRGRQGKEQPTPPAVNSLQVTCNRGSVAAPRAGGELRVSDVPGQGRGRARGHARVADRQAGLRIHGRQSTEEHPRQTATGPRSVPACTSRVLRLLLTR